jgi:hypothetical protein
MEESMYVVRFEVLDFASDEPKWSSSTHTTPNEAISKAVEVFEREDDRDQPIDGVVEVLSLHLNHEAEPVLTPMYRVIVPQSGETHFWDGELLLSCRDWFKRYDEDGLSDGRPHPFSS